MKQSGTAYVKLTSLCFWLSTETFLFIIGGADLIATTYNFVTGESTGGAYGPAYLVGGLLFFAICYPLSLMAARWEGRLKARDRASVEEIEKKEATA